MRAHQLREGQYYLGKDRWVRRIESIDGDVVMFVSMHRNGVPSTNVQQQESRAFAKHVARRANEEDVRGER